VRLPLEDRFESVDTAGYFTDNFTCARAGLWVTT
jgi:hypothetical protein